MSTNWLALLLAPQSNVINWLLLVVLLGWLIAKFVPPVLVARKQSIESEIESAKQTKENAAKLLAEQKQKIAIADQEADRILKEAKQAASEMQTQIAQQTEKDIADLLKKFDLALANERQMAISDMRAVAIRAAIKLAEENLRSAMGDQARAKLLTQFVEQLDSITGSSNSNPNHSTTVNSEHHLEGAYGSNKFSQQGV